MNIITIMIKEIKYNLRDKKAMCIMTLFPIVLIMVLGAAFSNSFDGSINIPKAEILYTNEATGEMGENIKKSLIEKGEEFNINFQEIKDIEKAKKIISRENKDSKYNGYIRITDNNAIELYKNDRHNMTSSLVENILNVYVQKYNTLSEIAKVNPLSIKEIMVDNKTNFTEITSLDAKREPSSKDYYAITMLTLIIMYGSMTGLEGINGEKTYKTGNRMLIAPIKKYEILSGKTLGSMVVTAFQMAIVILFSKYVLKTYWGDNMLPIILLILSFIIMTISMGVSVAFVIEDVNTANGMLNMIIPLFVFFGGGYVPLEAFNSKVINGIAKFSPVYWTNDTIFKVIYGSDFSQVIFTVLLNLCIAVVFIVVAAFMFRKEKV